MKMTEVQKTMTFAISPENRDHLKRRAYQEDRTLLSIIEELITCDAMGYQKQLKRVEKEIKEAMKREEEEKKNNV